MQSPNYRDNPEYYKKLIAKINGEANFPMHLYQNGYELIAKSAGSMEFRNETDHIVLQTNRNPITYFNRNDSLDKGQFFKYLMRRKPNFYKAVHAGLDIANQTYGLNNTDMEIKKTNVTAKSLEENYHVVPLRNAKYLKVQRGISQKTLKSEAFKDRILNAYHVRDNGGRIANIAFPKYDLEGIIKNYILYNRPYRSKTDNEIKKFRLVLNRKDYFLFYSKPSKNISKIVFGESGIDLLSYHELHGKPDNFYVSFGGNVYREKLEFFVQLIEPLLENKRTKLVSIMDNDLSGHEFDLKVYTAVINHYNPDIYIETAFPSDKVGMNVHYTEKIRGQLTRHANLLEEKLTSAIRKGNGTSGVVRCIGFSDKIRLEFSLREIIKPSPLNEKKNLFKTLLGTVNGLYLPFETDLHKSQGKDWNDDLRATKKVKYVTMDAVLRKNMDVGDKIELNTSKGPEGASNQGIIRSIKKNAVECDFGLHYTYAVPYSAIQAHFKKCSIEDIQQSNLKSKMNPKFNNLQNHTL